MWIMIKVGRPEPASARREREAKEQIPLCGFANEAELIKQAGCNAAISVIKRLKGIAAYVDYD